MITVIVLVTLIMRLNFHTVTSLPTSILFFSRPTCETGIKSHFCPYMEAVSSNKHMEALGSEKEKRGQEQTTGAEKRREEAWSVV